jgi:hypothetical protein
VGALSVSAGAPRRPIAGEDAWRARTRAPTTVTTPNIAARPTIRAERDEPWKATDSVCTCSSSLVADSRSFGHCNGDPPATSGEAVAGGIGEVSGCRVPGETSGSTSVPCCGEATVSGTKLFVGALRSTASGVVAVCASVIGSASDGPIVGGVTPWSVVVGKLVWAGGKGPRTGEMT